MDPQQIKELLSSIFLELIRYKGWCVAIFIAVSTTVLAVGFYWPQTYTTSSVLHAAETNIIEPLLRGRAELTEIDRAKTAKEIIYTRQFLEGVINEAGLTKTENPTPEQVEGLVKYLRKTIKVKSMGKEYFNLKFSSNDPDVSYQTLVATVQSFIAYTRKQKKEESYAAYSFIDAQVQAYKKQLEEAEFGLKEFKANNTEGSEAAVAEKLSALRGEIEELILAKDETESRIRTIKKQISSESSYLKARSKLESLEERKALLNQNLESLRMTYQESYPDVVTVKIQIEELDKKIESIYQAEGLSGGSKSGESTNPLYEELRIQLSVAEVDSRAQEQRLASLHKLLDREIVRARKIAANEAELSDLTRDYNVTKNVYEEMLGRKESARLSMVLDIEGQGVSYQIHEPAVYPLSSEGLKFFHFAVIGPFLGLMIPIGLVVAYIILDPRIRSASAVKANFSSVGFFFAVPYCTTALGTRVLKRDALLILAVSLVFVILYSLVVVNNYVPIF